MTVTRPASAQVLYGSAVGMVEDQSGARAPSATITMTNKTTGLTRVTAAGVDGHYTISDLLPGNFDVKVTAPGFKTLTKTDAENGSLRKVQ